MLRSESLLSFDQRDEVFSEGGTRRVLSFLVSKRPGAIRPSALGKERKTLMRSGCGNRLPPALRKANRSARGQGGDPAVKRELP